MRQLKISKDQFTKLDSKGLGRYLSDLSRYPVIRDPEEEADLARRIRDGDKTAYKILYTSNLRFVVSVAKKYQNRGLPLWDLIGFGNFGLDKAIPRFDETRGFKFLSYAVWWIRESIEKALADHGDSIRLPTGKISSNQKIYQKTIKLMQELEREPTDEEIMESLGISREEFEYLILDKKTLSLDAPLSEDGDGSLIDVLDLNEETSDKLLMKESLHQDLYSYMNLLTEKERLILTYSYGLNGERPLDLDEISCLMHKSSIKIRQSKEHAIRKLRKSSKRDILRSYL